MPSPLKELQTMLHCSNGANTTEQQPRETVTVSA
jgi:hypothetical protein